MRFAAIIASCTVLMSPVVAQEQQLLAENLTKYFGKTCLAYAPYVESIVNWKDTFNLSVMDTNVLSFYELIYGLNISNGTAVTLAGKTDIGVNYEVYLNDFDQNGKRFYGCSVGSPDVSSTALIAAVKAQYGLPGEPVLDKTYGSLRHRMWNLGSTSDPQYFIILGRVNGQDPTVILANFGKR